MKLHQYILAKDATDGIDDDTDEFNGSNSGEDSGSASDYDFDT